MSEATARIDAVKCSEAGVVGKHHWPDNHRIILHILFTWEQQYYSPVIYGLIRDYIRVIDLCIYIHTYMHACIHTNIQAYKHIYTYKHTYTYIHIHIHTHTYTYTYIHIHTHTHTHTYTYIHIHTHTYTYKHTYIQTYKHTNIHTNIHTNKHTYIDT